MHLIFLNYQLVRMIVMGKLYQWNNLVSRNEGLIKLFEEKPSLQTSAENEKS